MATFWQYLAQRASRDDELLLELIAWVEGQRRRAEATGNEALARSWEETLWALRRASSAYLNQIEEAERERALGVG